MTLDTRTVSYLRAAAFVGRCAAGAVLAFAAAGAVGLAHPVWAVVSSLVVAQEDVADTRRSIQWRALGTMLGALVAATVSAISLTRIDRPAVAMVLSQARRLAFGMCGTVFAIGSIFVNGVLAQNLPQVAGALGITVAHATSLTVAFLGAAAAANLLAIKARQQYPVDRVFAVLLWIEVAAGLLALARPGFAEALMTAAAHGLAMGTGVATAVFYLGEVWPTRRTVAVAAALGAVQLALPLGRLVPVEWLTLGGNRGLTLIGIALPAVQIVLLGICPPPPTLLRPVLRPLDFLSAALLAPAIMLFAGVLAMGPLHGWTQSPWLGGMLVLSLMLAASAMMIEQGRSEAPMLYMGWATRPYVLWPFLIAIVDRSLVAANGIGLVALLGPLALDNDQMHAAFIATAIGMVIGIAVVIRALGDETLPWLIVVALAATALAAMLAGGGGAMPDVGRLLMSQALLGCGTVMFSGPALVFAIRRLLAHGTEYFATQMVMYTFSQSMGLLAGSAWSLTVVGWTEGAASAGLRDATVRGFVPPSGMIDTLARGEAAFALYRVLELVAAGLALLLATFLLIRKIRPTR